MKKISLRAGLVTLSLLLLLTLGLLVGCDKNKDPVDTGTTTETTTQAATEAATETAPAETTLADLPAADALDSILADMENETVGDGDSVKLVFDMSIGVSANMGGVQNTSTIPLNITVVANGEDLQFNGNVMGQVFDITYVDGMLYMAAEDEAVKCAISLEEFEEVVLGEILGAVNAGADTAPDVSIPEGAKPSEIFSSITSELDSASGNLIITAKGLRASMYDTLAPIMKPMLEALGLVSEYDDNGELIDDTASVLARVVEILKGLDENNFTVTFTADKNGAFHGANVDITISTAEKVDGSTLTMTISLKGGFTYETGKDLKVTAPANAADYTEKDWRVVFGMETAEMLGLDPNAESITLSDDIELRSRQIDYITEHFDEFATVFNVSGYVVGCYLVDEETAAKPSDVGSWEGMICLMDPDTGEADYMSALFFRIPAGKVASLGVEAMPAEGAFVQIRSSKLEYVEDSDWGNFCYLLVADFTA